MMSEQERVDFGTWRVALSAHLKHFGSIKDWK